MLCSLPPPGTRKSGPNPNSNWLDRLRSNKGFPIADDLDLDHFLTNQNQNHPSSPLPPSNRPIPNSDSSSQNGIITDILSDLFNMNANSSSSSSSSSKKFPRKQSNPKICSIPSPIMNGKNLSSAAHKERNILSISSNSDNSSKGAQRPQTQIARAKVVKEDVEDELIGYSKSEVTVIDTSCDIWKSDKLIFRRKNVWKVKDKKGKLRNYGRKKNRKLSSQSTTNNHLPDIMIALPTNKTKLWGSEQRWKKSLKPFNNIGCNPQHCSGPEISANAPDSSNDQMETVYSISQGNGSYDPEKSDHPRA